MAEPDAATEPIYAFVLDRTYVFKHYFERTDVFEALSEYYDADEYRFEVPGREWDTVAATLREHRYAPEVVDDTTGFVVVKEQYTSHADVLRDSVANWTRRGHRFFLLPDPLAVERAVEVYGATPAEETEFVVGI